MADIITHSLRLGGANALFHVGVGMGTMQKWGRWNAQCFRRRIWYPANFMSRLGERMLKCKPLFPLIKTEVAPQKRARIADTEANRFRIGTFGLFPDPHGDHDEFRDGSRSLFSGSGGPISSPSECSVAETVRLPLSEWKLRDDTARFDREVPHWGADTDADEGVQTDMSNLEYPRSDNHECKV